MTFKHDDVETVNRLKRLLATYSYEEEADDEYESDEDDINLIIPLIEDLTVSETRFKVPTVISY